MLTVLETDLDLEARGRGEEWWYKGQPFTGKILELGDDGQILNEAEYVNGLLHGFERSYFPTGELESEIYYENGCGRDKYHYYYKSEKSR